MESAKGPWRRAHPPGRVDRIVANSFRTVSKWPPRKPRWFRANETMRRVEEDYMGPVDRVSALKLMDAALRMA